MLHYKDCPVLASEAATRDGPGVKVTIGPPQIVAARDDAPDEGTFVGPRLQRLGDDIYLNWKFDRDVLDPTLPDRPNGRTSRDGGLTWEKQTTLQPTGASFQTGPREISVWFRDGFEVPDCPGLYRVPCWRSTDLGRTWKDPDWTTVEYPGTRGLDPYNPPESFRRQDRNYLGGLVKTEPPPHLEPFFRQVSRLRGPALHPQASGPDGTLYSLVYSRYLKDFPKITDGDQAFWQRLNWHRYAVLLQTSKDQGRTWTFGGVPVDGSDYEPRLDVAPDGSPNCEASFIDRSGDPVSPSFKGRIDFEPGDGFSEPSLVVFPDGEMLCALRTGGHKPLYAIRSFDGGRTWSKASLLSPRYINPIGGVKPQLVLLGNGILALGTGRPDCTVHFSNDRGHTWFLSETLFSGTSLPWNGIFSKSHANVSMIAVGEHTLLYAHDATRPDPSAPHRWLKGAGHGLILLRRIEVCPTP